MLSRSDKSQIRIHLHKIKDRESRPVLDLFQKGQIYSFLHDLLDNDINPKGLAKPKEKEIVKEVVYEEISESRIQEIVAQVRSELIVTHGKDGKDGKDSPSAEEIAIQLKTDTTFLSNIKPNMPMYAGGSGVGVGEVEKIINRMRPLNPKMFGPEEDGNWRIIQDGEYLRFEYLDDGVWMEQGEVFVTNYAVDGMILTEDVQPITTENNEILTEE